MSHASTQDLVRLVRTGREFFLQMVKTMGCDCINGFGIGMKQVEGKKTERASLVFYVSRKLALRSLPVHNRIPQQINIPWEFADDGVLEVVTDVQTGTFQALANTGRVRPCPGGFSIGHEDITAGTLGCLVKDKTNGEGVILSNNHVLANTNQAAIGDPIIQPGAADGGAAPADVIAKLTRFKTIEFTAGVNNYVDAAIATPVDAGDVVRDIKDIGTNIPNATKDIGVGDLGLKVQKSGRTTEDTWGEVDAVAVTVTVKYGMFEKASFVDQIIVAADYNDPDFSAGGDSGSAILDEQEQLCGLLFAGSEKNESTREAATTIVNPIKHVFNLLSLEL